MPQFILIENETPLEGLQGIRLSALASSQDFLTEVAQHYFGDWGQCRLVTNLDGVSEPLIDDIWDAQLDGNPVKNQPFVQFLCRLVRDRVSFAIWCSNDYRDLPIATTWEDVMRELARQTRWQPADTWLLFSPPDTDETAIDSNSMVSGGAWRTAVRDCN
jgi:hypothetical protein